MRIFVALLLPEALKQSILSSTEALRKARPDIRWIVPENLHVTLAFLGELNGRGLELAIAAARAALYAGAPGFGRGPLTLSANGILTLPPRGRARVVAAAVVEGAKEAAELANGFETSLASTGREYSYAFRPREKRAFFPHITLARAGRNPIALSDEERAVPVSASGLVSSIAVYESTLGPNGARYTVLEEFGLQRLGSGA